MTDCEADKKQNITLRLDGETIRKVKELAATRSSSVSKLVTERIERLFAEVEAHVQPAISRSNAE